MKHYLYLVALASLFYSCSNPEKDFEKAKQENTEEAYNHFIAKHSDSELISQAEKALHLCAFNEALKKGTAESLMNFLNKYPSTEYSNQAQKDFLAISFSKDSFSEISPKDIFMIHFNYFEKNGRYIENLDKPINSLDNSDMLPYKEISYLFSDNSNREVTVYYKSTMKKGRFDMKLGNKTILKWENDCWNYDSSYQGIINQFEKDWKTNKNVKWGPRSKSDEDVKDFKLNDIFGAYQNK